MSKMFELVDELRDQLQTVGDTEQKLVASLREALNRYDQKLLQDVRSLAAEHEVRRGAILGELRGLASRMGAFPSLREPHECLLVGTGARKSAGSTAEHCGGFAAQRQAARRAGRRLARGGRAPARRTRRLFQEAGVKPAA